jgi:hypothetical protein
MKKIFLIITCCVKNNDGATWADRRRQEYYLAISNVLNLVRTHKNITPIIVENSMPYQSYLDVFNSKILYTNDNSRLIEGTTILHKGSREILDIRKVIEKYGIEEDDMIIKITGRYLLFKDDFFKTVLDNLDKEAIFRPYNVCTYDTGNIHMVLGLFALKCKYFKMFNYAKCEKVGAEEDFRTFINETISEDKILIVNKLWLRVTIGMNNKIVDC